LFSQIIIIFFIFTFRVYLRSQASPWVKVHRPSLLHPLQHLVVVQQSALHHRRPSWGKFWHWSVGGSLTRSTKGMRSSKQILQWIEYTSYPNTGGRGPWYMQTFYLQFCIYAIENMAFQRNVCFNLPKQLVLLFANLLYTKQFFRSLSMAYNEAVFSTIDVEVLKYRRPSLNMILLSAILHLYN